MAAKSEEYSCFIGFLCSRKQWAKLETLARSSGQTLSDTLRDLIDEAEDRGLIHWHAEPEPWEEGWDHVPTLPI